jgi:RNA polymerase sigma-70 factor (ECF subfamily)
MTIDEELSLIKQAQSGNRDSLARLWDAITPKLYGYLVNTLKNKELADDCLQEAWLKAVTHLNQFKPRGVRFSAWVFAIARNVCREHWRKNKQAASVSELQKDDSDRLLSKEAVEEKMLVETVFSHISNDEAEIIRLRFIGGFSFKEIASLLGISALTARVRLHRALVRARAILN